jgi:hypothetical protein
VQALLHPTDTLNGHHIIDGIFDRSVGNKEDLGMGHKYKIWLPLSAVFWTHQIISFVQSCPLAFTSSLSHELVSLVYPLINRDKDSPQRENSFGFICKGFRSSVAKDSSLFSTKMSATFSTLVRNGSNTSASSSG